MMFICSWHEKYFPGALTNGEVIVVERKGSKPSRCEIRHIMKKEDVDGVILSHGICYYCGEKMEKELDDEAEKVQAG